MSTRRQFLTTVAGTSAVLSFTGTAPQFLCQAANAEEKGDAKNRGRVLVVVQLSGGNDGLNTVVPFKHDVYAKHRKTLQIAKQDVLKIDSEYGFHPALSGLAELIEGGKLGIVPAVGYDNPNRSHFESMDIWHTCRRKQDRRNTGWLGQYLESQKATELPGIHIGQEKQPLALAARDLRVPSIGSLEQFRLKSDPGGHVARLLQKAFEQTRPDTNSENDLLGFLQSSTQAAVSANNRIEKVRSQGRSSGGYPETRLGKKLSTIGRLVKAELPTRVYYVTHEGFDTHAKQAGAHESLLRQLGDAVAAFQKDMDSSGNAERVLLMAFSEFGRRVAENASEGTDHGTAGPLFVAGKKAKPGFTAPHSDLTELKDGDLKFKTDFRSVYAGILNDWFELKDTSSLLGGSFKPVKLLT